MWYSPMNGHIILCVVGHINQNSISFSGINCRSREHPIHCDNWLGVTQPAYILHLYLHENISRPQFKIRNKTNWSNVIAKVLSEQAHIELVSL